MSQSPSPRPQPLGAMFEQRDAWVAVEYETRRKNRYIATIVAVVLTFNIGMALIGSPWSFALGLAFLIAADRYDCRKRPGTDEIPLAAYLTTVVALAAILVAVAALVVFVLVVVL